MTTFVKNQRRYDSSRRRAQAALTREEIVTIASRRFLVGGYAGTTLSSIARDARVSVETIHKAFGGKAGLMRALWAKGLEGAGPIPAERRSDAIRTSTPDARELIRRWGELTCEVAPRTAPILLLIRSAAASDPQLAAILAEAEEQRLQRMEENARTLHERGQLRAGVTLERARDILWSYSSPEWYELLVVKRGWSPEEHGAFVGNSVAAALLPNPAE